MDVPLYYWTHAGIEELKDYAPRYKKRGCPEPGDQVSQNIIDDEARMGFQPSWFLDLGHWAADKRQASHKLLNSSAVALPSEEELITSVWPPLCPQELDICTRIKCSVCGQQIDPEDVEEHSRRCVSSERASRGPLGSLFGRSQSEPGPQYPSNLDEVSTGDAAWTSIVDLLQAASVANSKRYGYALCLKKLHRVRPTVILQQYEEEGARLGAPTQLFYGTRLDKARSISREGFKLPDKAGPFGKGVHLAPCPLMSASLAPETSWMPLAKRIVTRPWAALKKENGTMLLCDAYLGTTLTLRWKNKDFNPAEDLKGGWLRESLGLGDYDSVYAPGGFFGAVSVDEYVVYKVKQAVPRYVIEFEYERK